MVFERIYGIIGGAHRLYIIFAHQAAGGEFRTGEHLVASVIDFVRSGGVEHLVNAEGCLELQMSPMIERIAKSVGESLGPLHEFLARVGISGDIALVNSVGSQRAPFIMITAEPEFGDVGESFIFSYLFRRKMAVIVNNGKLFGMLMIETARALRVKKKIFVDEGSHYIGFSFNCI